MVRDGIITRETLNLILLLDNSGSMYWNGKIDQLNLGVAQLKDSLLPVANEEGVDIKLRVLSFSDDVKWLVGRVEEGVNIEDFNWNDIVTEGGTRTDLALSEANKALRKQYLGAHALRPVVVLITDGYCNEEQHGDYLREIEAMKKKLSGSSGKEKVTKIAIGVQDYNRPELEEFASVGYYHDTEQPLIFEVDNVAELSKVINFVAVSSMYSSMADDSDKIVLGDEEDFV